jgi:hypothetical protein
MVISIRGLIARKPFFLLQSRYMRRAILIVKLDLTYVPENIRSLLVKSIEPELIAASNSLNVSVVTNRYYKDKKKEKYNNDKKSSTVVTSIAFYYNKPSQEELKDFLKNILDKNNLDQFIVVEDTENENTLAIVREGDIEQFGMFMCSHCGMLFKSEEEKIVHERIHYFM